MPRTWGAIGETLWLESMGSIANVSNLGNADFSGLDGRRGGCGAGCEMGELTRGGYEMKARASQVIEPLTGKKSNVITETSWPKNLVKSIETRKRDLVIRIADWTRDREEQAYDVEVYVAGVYDWNQSRVFPTRSAGRHKSEARHDAVEFAKHQIACLLK